MPAVASKRYTRISPLTVPFPVMLYFLYVEGKIQTCYVDVRFKISFLKLRLIPYAWVVSYCAALQLWICLNSLTR